MEGEFVGQFGGSGFAEEKVDCGTSESGPTLPCKT